MDAETALRRQEAYISQRILDVHTELSILNRKHTELIEQRVDIINELGKFVIARTEV